MHTDKESLSKCRHNVWLLCREGNEFLIHLEIKVFSQRVDISNQFDWLRQDYHQSNWSKLNSFFKYMYRCSCKWILNYTCTVHMYITWNYIIFYFYLWKNYKILGFNFYRSSIRLKYILIHYNNYTCVVQYMK